MKTCEVCGAAVDASVASRDESASDLAATAGRAFFGLPSEAALCRTCLAEVRETGATVWEAERGVLCLSCRGRIERAWSAPHPQPPAARGREAPAVPWPAPEAARPAVNPHR
ncbi:MAG: hypothetical protein Kow0092_30610 [Deferrisomatales bacterium]